MEKFSLKKIQFFRYVMVGGFSTLIHMLVGYMYLYYVEYSLFLSNIVAFFVAFTFSYTYQTLYVFRLKKSLINLAKYLTIQLLMIYGGMLIIDNMSNYNYYIKTVFLLIVITPTSFIFHKFWTFN